MSPARTFLVLGALYFSQGLPFGFFTQALPVLMRKQGSSLEDIGLSSLLALPWALKFLWAPLVDRHGSERFGRRRSWIVPLQLATVALLLGLSVLLDGSLPLLMGAVLVVNLLAATQDIATDGLAVELLSPAQRGLANGLQVAGYRVGMIVGGGALLVFAGRLGLPLTFAAMAALTALATLPLLVTREPAPAAPPSTHGARPELHFLRRPGAVRILLLLVTYKTGDAFATGMLRPFLADLGLGLEELGWMLGTVGFVAGLVGALVGGAFVNRFGRRGSLVAFALLQAVAVAGYALLALGAPTRAWLQAICAVEHFAGGMATAALFTCMMDWCSRTASATDYTVQASAVVIATGAASALAGFSAQALGYASHFALATALAFAAVPAVFALFPVAQEAVPCAPPSMPAPSTR